MSAYRLDNGRSTAAGVVNLAGTVLALILATHIVLVLASANAANPAVRWVGRAADVVAVWFVNLINTGNADFSVVVNYGLAAACWLFVTGLIARLLCSVG
jgi:hypothetical protein